MYTSGAFETVRCGSKLPRAQRETIYLVFASGAARGVSRLGVRGTLLHLFPLQRHLCKVHVRADRVLVTVLSRVDTRRVRAVALESLKGVEVQGRPRGVGVPRVVNVLLGLIVPKCVVVLAVLETTSGGRSGSSRSGSSRSLSGRSSRSSTTTVTLLQVLLEGRSSGDGLTGILVLHGVGVAGVEHAAGALLHVEGGGGPEGGLGSERRGGRDGGEDDGGGELHLGQV
mmetsp:Transcript_8893/g.16424  ORF Transcript_8893/g.16424 Transcript_8893/m.16424 type:complete len:228 (+) Transcript_8893:235-918(+)